MCGRYAAARDSVEVAEWFGVEELPERDLPLRYNIAPTSEAFIVSDDDGTRRLEIARWGLIPSWSKDASHAARMINARSETVHEKPAYRSAFKRRRCLVPADGYYEWQSPPPGTKGAKQPYYIHRADGAPLALAGLFEDWTGPEGTVRSYSILTQDSVGPLSGIHDRMPVLVAEQEWGDWLDPAVPDPRLLLDTMVASDRALIQSGQLLSAYPVSTRVNKAGNEGSDLRESIAVVSRDRDA